MLDSHQRAARYRAQTGRADLTPRQRRRITHKVGHQSQDAVARREGAARVGSRGARASARTAR